MDAMICPHCLEDVTPVAYVGQVTVCPSCARTVVQEADGYRLATSNDTLALGDLEREQLRKLRPKVWRDARKARLQQILGARAR